MKTILSSLVLLSTITFSVTGFAKEPVNLNVYKQEAMKYHDSGEYEKDINVVIKNAIRYLRSRLSYGDFNDKKPAIVLDIDETALSNYPGLIKLSFGGTLKQIIAEADKGEDPVIEPTLKLYRFAKSHDIAVFFVTGRQAFELNSTSANLRRVGYKNWDGLYLRSKADADKPAAEYKIAIRKKLTDNGYDILANIGDQQSDLRGGYADMSFKLPNPFYLIP